MIICITGPTAVGKTKLSIELAKKYDAVVINADSAQVYKELNIGTAKVTDEEKEGIKHYLLDIVTIEDEYNVFLYQQQGRTILDKLIKENKNVIIVGGTGLYIKALLYDYRFNTLIEDNTLDNLTNEALYEKVITLDSKSNVNINNRQRMLSFIKNFSTTKEYNKDKLLYDTIFIGLTTPRDNLYSKINNRVDNMFNNGLLDEVITLSSKYKDNQLLSKIIGYKEVIKYLNKELTKEECVDLIKKNSRHYAKRQYTWFNNQMKLNYINVDYDNFNNTINLAIEIINK